MQETQEAWVQSLGQKDPLEKEMATHCSILAWRIPRAEGNNRKPFRWESNMIEFSCQNDLFGHRAANDWMWVRLESEPVAAGISDSTVLLTPA